MKALRTVRALATKRWALLLAVCCLLLVVCVLPVQRVSQAGDWIVPAVLIFSVMVFVLEIFPTLIKRERRRERAKLGLSALVVVSTGIQMIADFREERFEAVTTASGTISIWFSRVLRPGELRISGADIFIVKAPLTSQRIYGTFHVRNIQSFVGAPVTTPGQPGETRGTQIQMDLDNAPGLLAGQLDQLSARSLPSDFDYLVFGGDLAVPAGVSFAGSLHLLLNGTRLIELEIPRHHVTRSTRLIIPLNERARRLMLDYELFNPAGGSKSADLPGRNSDSPALPARLPRVQKSPLEFSHPSHPAHQQW
jgi:hypothetical protein